MPKHTFRWPLAAAIVILSAAAAHAADEKAKALGHVVIQTVPPGVPVAGSVPPLHLSDAQRTRIAQVLATQNTEVDLNLKSHKNAASFDPKVDEKVPKALKAQAFPMPLITEMPPIREYTYLKFKDQVLIVNPLTGKIVDMFPETKS